MTNGQWHHVAGTFDGLVLRLFVDGVLQEEEFLGPVTIQQSNDMLAIGRQGSRSKEEFDGRIDEVRIWNVSRDLCQIQATMNGPVSSLYTASPDSGLMGYWRFDTPGGAVIDWSSNTNNAIIHGGSFVSSGGFSAKFVTAPAEGDLWIAGQADTIRWQNLCVDSVDIFYTLDGEADVVEFQEIVKDFPTDSGQFVWEIPDTLLSRKVRLCISYTKNPFLRWESGLFKIKGYELTRITANNDWERFEPSKHGWKFANKEKNMWPQSWWQQFDYLNGNDPFTGQPYPEEWLGPNIFADPQVFPAWPTFVRAYGIEQSYLSGAIYSPIAVTKWAKYHNVESWGGSCSGFAISSLQAFDNPTTFLSSYPDIQPFQNISELDTSKATRETINQLWAHQGGKQHKEFTNSQTNNTPLQTVQEILDMFAREMRDDQYLYIKNSTSGAHAVVPYKIQPVNEQPGFVRVYIYDNNWPADSDRFIVADTVGMTWHYIQSPVYNGSKGFFLVDPVSNYYETPILQSTENFLEPHPVSNKTGQRNSNFIEISVTTAAEVNITNPAGQSIGYVDSTAFNELPDGFELIPLTGYFSPPVGYYLSEDVYTARLNNFSDSLSLFTVFEDSLIYSYSRTAARPEQRDDFVYRDGLVVCNFDAAVKSFNLQTVMQLDKSERVVDVFNCSISQNDSVRFKTMERRDLKITNYGSTKSYDLRLTSVSAAGQIQTDFRVLNLPENSSHLVCPNWENLESENVIILVDIGNDGTVDDTLVVDFTTGVSSEYSDTIPFEFSLEQNYPNPFNPSTTIRFAIPLDAHVSLKIYDILGREVTTLVDGKYRAGNYNVVFDAKDLSNGVYFYRIQAKSKSGDRYIQTKKLTLLK